MLTALSAALVYGLTGGLAPGPLMTLVIGQTLRYGAKEGIKTSLAPLITDGPIIVVLLLFLDRIAAIRPLLGGIAVAGVAFLLYLAWESWNAPPPAARETQAPRSVLRGTLTNFLNPSPYLFWLTAGTPMLVKAWRHSALAAALFVVVFFVCLVGSKIVLAMIVSRSRERVLGRWYRPVMRILAALLVVFAAIVARDAAALFTSARGSLGPAPAVLPSRAMNRRALEEAVAALPDWFHSIDLGGGVITPGAKTQAMLEAELASLRLPDLAGKSVLDIGAYDGFYTFAAERLGAARVVALDHFVWSLDHAKLRELGQVPFLELERSAAWDPVGLPGKRRFDLAYRALGSRAETMVADFHEVDFDAAGGPFDVVLFLGVLYHMRAPLTSLERVARATGGMAVIETEAMEISRSGGRALCEFFEGAEMEGDYTNWWVPNEKALLGMCRAAGFARAEIMRSAPKGTGGRLHQLAAARAAGLGARQIVRRAAHRLWEELGGVRRYRAIVHAWK